MESNLVTNLAPNLMTGGDAAVLGLIQGFTEYLPVSSSAHLLLAPKFMQIQEGGLAFDVFLHIGTLLSTVIYFWKDWMQILMNPKPKVGAMNLSWIHIGVATLPALIAGAALHSLVEDSLRSPWVTVWTLTGFGILLYAVDHYQKKHDSLQHCTVRKIFWIGLAQCMALVPGVSRSGSTITAGRALGFSRTTAARISFLMSMPVTLAAIVYELKDYDQVVASLNGWQPILYGATAAFFSGILAIHFMIKLLANISYAGFMIYRILLALAVVMVLL